MPSVSVNHIILVNTISEVGTFFFCFYFLLLIIGQFHIIKTDTADYIILKAIYFEVWWFLSFLCGT